MIDRVIDIGGCYGVEMKVDEIEVIRISRELSPLQIMMDQKQLENVEYVKHLGKMVVNNARCTRKIESRNVATKAAFYRTKTPFASKLDLHFRK
jgi:hypothetical protein